MEVKIIYENTDFIVCEKPTGMLTLPSESDEKSLIDIISEQIGKKLLYPVHRLDRMTGGLVVFAKHKRAASELSVIFAEHKNEKQYFCVVHGIPEKEERSYTDLLFADKKANKAYITDKARKGVKEARLSYRLLQTRRHKEKEISLLEVSLYTGRMHQIRAQLSHHGHPLLGDGKYGSKENSCSVALHAYRLAFSYNGDFEFFSHPSEDFPWCLFEIKR